MTTTWPSGIRTITIFAEQLAETREFYERVFNAPVIYSDDVSVVFGLENLQINLLAASEAPGLVEPRLIGSAETGPRTLFTVTVDDVDVAVALLAERGVSLLNGPMNRPWGLRTAAFVDPAGIAWEVAGPPA